MITRRQRRKRPRRSVSYVEELSALPTKLALNCGIFHKCFCQEQILRRGNLDIPVITYDHTDLPSHPLHKGSVVCPGKPFRICKFMGSTYHCIPESLRRLGQPERFPGRSRNNHGIPYHFHRILDRNSSHCSVKLE